MKLLKEKDSPPSERMRKKGSNQVGERSRNYEEERNESKQTVDANVFPTKKALFHLVLPSLINQYTVKKNSVTGRKPIVAFGSLGKIS